MSLTGERREVVYRYGADQKCTLFCMQHFHILAQRRRTSTGRCRSCSATIPAPTEAAAASDAQTEATEASDAAAALARRAQQPVRPGGAARAADSHPVGPGPAAAAEAKAAAAGCRSPAADHSSTLVLGTGLDRCLIDTFIHSCTFLEVNFSTAIASLTHLCKLTVVTGSYRITAHSHR